MTPLEIFSVLNFESWRGRRLEGNILQNMVVTGSSDENIVILRTLTSNFLKIDMQSSSYSWLMEIRDPIFNSSRMEECCALLESSLIRVTLAWREGVTMPLFITVTSGPYALVMLE